MSDCAPAFPTFDVIPHIGVPPVRFGMSYNDVVAKLGQPREGSHPLALFYYENCLLVNFDHRGVTYIELSAGRRSGLMARYKDAVLADTEADALVEHISRDAAATVEEDGHTVIFYDLDLALWRPVLPSDYGPEEADDSYRKGRYWMTIGVGYGECFLSKRTVTRGK